MDAPLLHDWVLAHAAAQPGAPAIAAGGTRLSYGELAERALGLASEFASVGIGRGDRVLLALPNLPATVVAAVAISLRGAVSVEVSREWRAELLSEVVARSGVRAAILWHRDVPTWSGALSTPALAAAGVALDDLWLVGPAGAPVDSTAGAFARRVRSLLEDGQLDPVGASRPRDAAEVATPPIDPGDPAVILFTSGSTGRPHGVVQTARNIDANTRSIVQYLELGPSDRAMLTLPLSYCYGRSVLQTHLFVGGSIVLDNRMAFPRRVLEAIGAERCTGFAGVPLTFELIRRQVDVSTIDRTALRYVTQAGGAMAADTISWARAAFAPARLFVMYGQTEATARLSYLPPERAHDKTGSIGVAIPGVELRVVDDQARELPADEVGELIARGDNVTSGYLDEPEETARILRDGWLWTGDLASRDSDGFLYVKGRSREILKIGGRRISPTEIEEAIVRAHDVVEAAVVGIPDAITGEAPVAFVVLQPGASLDEADLVRTCRERLPAQLVPRTFIVVDALPRNPAGKLLRTDLARTLRG